MAGGATPSAPGALEGVLAESRRLGFTGPGPLEAQIDHARGFAAALVGTGVTAAASRVLDLGSGGGLPGLVLALEWPGAQVVLLDSSERRTRFLTEAVAECGVGDRVSVVRARAEEAGTDPAHRSAYDLVVARSFGPPAVTAECAAPFLAVGGHLVTSEPPAGVPAGDGPQGSTARWPPEGLAELGMVEVATVTEPFAFHVVRQVEPVGARFPRRVGAAAKRPLF